MAKSTWSIGDTLYPRNSEPLRVVKIKRGGWGEVYIAEGQDCSQLEAIKTLQDRFLKDELVVRRFIQEAHLWIGLDRHPNIVNAHFADTIGGRPCLFMEYVDGGTLRSRLTPQPLPVEQAIEFALQLARGMRFVWQTKRVVHRDLKPENLLLTRTNQLKVTDFGLAHAVGLAGTPHYMAPEQFHLAQVQTQADVYALGLVLFEMLTGQIPHVSSGTGWVGKINLKTLSKRRNSERVPDPRRWNPGIPKPISRLILDCLAVEPEQRLPDFEVVCQRLESLATSLHPIGSADSLGIPHSLLDNLMDAGAARAQALSIQGASLSNLGRYEEAVSFYDRALSSNDQISEIWKNKSTALLRLGRYEEALDCSERALALGSHTVKIVDADRARDIILMSWTNKTAALTEMGRFDEALAACEEALVLDSTYPRLWNNKASVLLNLGRLQEALTCIEQAIELDPAYEKGWSLRGNIQARLGNVTEALHAFEKLLSINPRNADGLVGKAQCLAALGLTDECAQLLQTAQRIAPRDFPRFLKQLLDPAEAAVGGGLNSLLAAASIAQQIGDHRRAAELYEEAIQLDSTCADAWNNRGDCLYELGEITEAVSCFERTLELDPNHANALLNLSRFSFDSGRLQAGLEYAERASEADPQNDMAWNNKGAALLRLGRVQDGIISLNQALELNPNNVLAWTNLGVARLTSGDESGAETCFLEALTLSPNLEPVRHMLRQCRLNWRRQFLDYNSLKAKYPDYDYYYVLNGQVNPSDMPLIHKAILDCGYMLETLGGKSFESAITVDESLGLPRISKISGMIEHILMAVPSFNMAFDALLEGVEQDTVAAVRNLLALTHFASGISSSRRIIKLVDINVSVRSMTGTLTPDECVELQFALNNPEVQRELQDFIEILRGR